MLVVKVGHANHDGAWSILEVWMVAEVIYRLLRSPELSRSENWGSWGLESQEDEA